MGTNPFFSKAMVVVEESGASVVVGGDSVVVQNSGVVVVELVVLSLKKEGEIDNRDEMSNELLCTWQVERKI